VHGPLQAVLLAELARRHAPGRDVAFFEFRGLAPAFDEGPLLVRARRATPDEWELEAIAASGEGEHGGQAALRRLIPAPGPCGPRSCGPVRGHALGGSTIC
jgi:hypothetical protein